MAEPGSAFSLAVPWTRATTRRLSQNGDEEDLSQNGDYLQSYNPINLKPRERFTSSFILLRRTWFCRRMTTRKHPEGPRKGAESKKQASRLHAVRCSLKNKRLACTACVFASQAPLHPHAYYLAPCTSASKKLSN